MSSIHLILIVFFFVCEVLAALGVPSSRFNLMAAGLAFYAAALLF